MFRCRDAPLCRSGTQKYRSNSELCFNHFRTVVSADTTGGSRLLRLLKFWTATDSRSVSVRPKPTFVAVCDLIRRWLWGWQSNHVRLSDFGTADCSSAIESGQAWGLPAARPFFCVDGMTIVDCRMSPQSFIPLLVECGEGHPRKSPSGRRSETRSPRGFATRRSRNLRRLPCRQPDGVTAASIRSNSSPVTGRAFITSSTSSFSTSRNRFESTHDDGTVPDESHDGSHRGIHCHWSPRTSSLTLITGQTVDPERTPACRSVIALRRQASASVSCLFKSRRFRMIRSATPIRQQSSRRVMSARIRLPFGYLR